MNIYLEISKEVARLVENESLTYAEAIKKAKKMFGLETKKEMA